MNRMERYKAAAYLAQLIVENSRDNDPMLLEQARDDIFDEVIHLRRAQREFADTANQTRERLIALFDDNERHSIRAPLHVVLSDSEFHDLAYPDGAA